MKKQLFNTLIILLFSALILSFQSSNKQHPKNKDISAIKSMCGCYEVDFNFAETFNYTNDSTYTPSKIKHDKGLEWVELVTDEESELVLQHLLIVEYNDEKMLIKHWRQDWLFENTKFYTYAGLQNTWDFTQVDSASVEGQWTQKVYQVDDSPRYEGTGTWVHINGKSYWESETYAPLPRREFSTRDDYNIMLRRTRHEITSWGWLHDQDNDKIVRKKDSKDFVIAQEKGINNYRKVADEKCKFAQDWWTENQNLWQDVRNIWSNIYNQNSTFSMHNKVEDKKLFQHLFPLDPKTPKNELEKIVNSFIRVE